MSEQQRNRRRVVQGVVASDRMDKGITVTVVRTYKHPKYKKYIRRHDKVYAHDATNEARTGDTVELMECRPLSKTKRWRLVKVLGLAVLPSISASGSGASASGASAPGGGVV